MRYRYRINNLDCANCAREVEEYLEKDARFQHVRVNFNTAKLTFDSSVEISVTALNELVQKVEPGVTIEKFEYDKRNGGGRETANYKIRMQFWLLVAGLAIGITTYFSTLPDLIKLACHVLSYGLLLWFTTINAIKALLKSHTLNENALITISCIGALMIGEVLEGMMVVALYTVGKLLETKALNNSRRSVENLLNLKQPFVQRKLAGKIERVGIEEIKPDDIIIIRKGDRVPVDGEVIEGTTELDLSALTGESERVKVSTKDKVLSGAINLGNVIQVRATTNYADSTVAKILELLEEATDRKAKTETVVAKISKIYTPVILGLAILVSLILPLVFRVPMTDSIYRGLTFLVIACPCAIAISVPLSYFTGIGVAGKHGILVKGSNYLDNLSSAKNVIFDKTGTLTNGDFAVSEIKITDARYSEAEIIEILAQGEALSNHPIAQSILKLYNGKLDSRKVKNFQERVGGGISYEIGRDKIKVGNKMLCACTENAVLHLNINGKHVASIKINDGIKSEAKTTIGQLIKLGMATYMFTGDKKQVAQMVAESIGIEHVQTEMLPTTKFRAYEQIADKNGLTIFVGDGINDAPVLKRADIGIAMGGVGSESAIEAADVVIMNDDLTNILKAIQISRYTKSVIYQNLVFAVSVKFIILILSVFGLTNMWWAVFADTGVTLLTILSTLRVMYKFSN